MDLKHYEQLKPVNEHLAITAQTGIIDHNDMFKALGVTPERILELVEHSDSITENSDNLRPRSAAESILLYSKLCKTPAELVWCAFNLGRYEHMSNPNVKSELAFAMTKFEAERRHKHAH